MAKMRVGILFGGKSGEHEVSIVSARNVAKALDPKKYDVTLIGIDKNGRWVLSNPSDLLEASNPRLLNLNKQGNAVTFVPYSHSKSLVGIDSKVAAPDFKFDVVLPILHGTFGEDGTVQGLLELANVAYVGSGVIGSAVGMDKDVSRRLLREAGIPVVKTCVIKKWEFEKNQKTTYENLVRELGLPFFIKPANAGSSVGVHKVKTEKDFFEKIKDSFEFDTKVLAEKSVAARELEVAVLGNHEPKASIVGEIVPTHEFYSYEAKYIDENGAHLHIPAINLTPELSDTIRALAVKTFQVLELRAMARVDFFLDKNTGELYLNEVNTIPGFTNISMYPKLWEASGIGYSALIDRLIELALELHSEKNQLKTTYEIKQQKLFIRPS